MAVIPGTRNFKTWAGFYDFAVDGGGTGTITLRSNDGPIPIGSVILDGYLDVTTACLSATGTIALQAEAAADPRAARDDAPPRGGPGAGGKKGAADSPAGHGDRHGGVHRGRVHARARVPLS